MIRTLLLAIITLLTVVPSPAFAEKFAEKNAENLNPETEYEQVQEQLDEEKKRISELLLKEGSLLTELDRIAKLLKARKDELKKLDREAKKLQQKLILTEDQRDILSKDIDQRRELFRKRMRSLYRHYREGEIAALVSTDDYQSFISEARLLSYLTYTDSLLIQQYKSDRKELIQKENRLLDIQQEIRSSKARAAAKKRDVERQRKKRKLLLAGVKSNKEHSRRMIQELEKASEELKEIIRLAEEMKPEAIPPGASFAELVGRLPWPVQGTVTVNFGSQNDPQFDTPVVRNGIEIRTGATGERVLSVHAGVVVYADWFKGFGQLIIINHGKGYHSLYAHLSEMYIKTSQVITERQVIGKVGETGTYSEPGLYFEIRKKGKPVDPMKWLTPK